MAARPSRLRRRFALLVSRASMSLASQWWRTRRVLRPRIPALARARVCRTHGLRHASRLRRGISAGRLPTQEHRSRAWLAGPASGDARYSSTGHGRPRKSLHLGGCCDHRENPRIPMRARVVACLLQLATVDLTLRRYDTDGRRSDEHRAARKPALSVQRKRRDCPARTTIPPRDLQR